MGVVDGIPERPVGVCELIDEDQRQMLSEVYDEGQVMGKEQCLRALRHVAGVIDTVKR